MNECGMVCLTEDLIPSIDRTVPSFQVLTGTPRQQHEMRSQQADTGFSISRLIGINGTQVEASKTNCRKNVVDEINTILNDESTKRSERRKASKRSKKSTAEEGSKRYRTTFEKTQIDDMERIFLLNHYPDVTARSEMSSRIGLSEAQVQISFQNRRAKWRKQQRQRHHAPVIFGVGYPSHLTRFYGGLDHCNYFPYDYYNTDVWTCARQQVAAFHFTSSSPGRVLVPSPDGSPSNDSTASGLEEPLVKSKRDSSSQSLHLKAKRHAPTMEPV